MFQSPCAGNMFGKLAEVTSAADAASNAALAFQSPCAGNMFGKSSIVVSR